MAKGIIVSNGNGGDSSTDCTATRAQVLENYTAITKDSEDDAIAGTMQHLTARTPIRFSSTNNTNVIVTDSAYTDTNTDGIKRTCFRYYGNDGFIQKGTLFGFPSQSKTITPGKTQQTIKADSGKVLESVTINSLGGNATANKVLAGTTFSSDAAGRGIAGSIPAIAGQSITPNTSQQTLSCSGKYMTGNITVPAFSLPPASAIKKGYSYSLYGKTVTGTHSGFVADASDIYNRGSMGN